MKTNVLPTTAKSDNKFLIEKVEGGWKITGEGKELYKPTLKRFRQFIFNQIPNTAKVEVEIKVTK